MITLINPETGVKFQYEGRWLRPGKATDGDVRRRRAQFRGEKVYLNLPPGVQNQLDKGVLQVDTDYLAREQLAASETVEAAQPKGNASQEAWLSYAISQGMPREEAAGLTRDQIRARFTAPSFDPDAPPDGMELLNPDDIPRD
jgi:hypothetical protein